MIQRPSRRMDGTLGVGMMGRLKPGVTIEQAFAEMRVLDRYRLEDMAKTRQSAASVRGVTIELEPAAAGFATLRDRFATSLLVLMAVVALLLLIACTNVASMLLARGAARQHEMALRVSLGAGRVRLVRQVLTESLLLAAMGGLIGVALASVGAETLVRIMLSGREFLRMQQRIEIQVQPDLQVLLFTATVAVLTAVLFGAAPAWHASDLCAGILAARTRRRWRDTIAPPVWQEPRRGPSRLVGRAAERRGPVRAPPLEPAEPGLRLSAHVLAAGHTGSGEIADIRVNSCSRRTRHLLGRLAEIPGVRSVTLSAVTPISGAGASRFIKVEGFEEAADARRYVPLNWVGPRYFETFGTPLARRARFRVHGQGRPARGHRQSGHGPLLLWRQESDRRAFPVGRPVQQWHHRRSARSGVRNRRRGGRCEISGSA